MQNICNKHCSPVVNREGAASLLISFLLQRQSDVTIRNEVVQCGSALISSELFNSAIVALRVVLPAICRFYLAQVILKLYFSLSTCMFESQLKLGLKASVLTVLLFLREVKWIWFLF